MADNQKLTGTQQRQSIQDEYDNPSSAIDPAVLAKIKAMMDQGTPTQSLVSPADQQSMNQTSDSNIAAMQAANLARAQQDPAFAAKLQAVQQLRDRQVDAQMGKLNALPPNPAGTPTPPVPAMPIPKTPEEEQEQSLGTTYSARE